MSTTQTSEIARSDVYTDAEALLAAAQQIAALRRTLERISAHASAMADLPPGHPATEHGFAALAAMAEIGLRDA